MVHTNGVLNSSSKGIDGCDEEELDRNSKRSAVVTNRLHIVLLRWKKRCLVPKSERKKRFESANRNPPSAAGRSFFTGNGEKNECLLGCTGVRLKQWCRHAQHALWLPPPPPVLLKVKTSVISDIVLFYYFPPCIFHLEKSCPRQNRYPAIYVRT